MFPSVGEYLYYKNSVFWRHVTYSERKVSVMRKSATKNLSLSLPPVITVARYIRPKNLLSTHIYYNRIGGTLMPLF